MQSGEQGWQLLGPVSCELHFLCVPLRPSLLPSLSEKNGEGGSSQRENFATPDFAPMDHWQGLEAFPVITQGERNATDIQWVEAKDAAEYPSVHRTAPHKELSSPE